MCNFFERHDAEKGSWMMNSLWHLRILLVQTSDNQGIPLGRVKIYLVERSLFGRCYLLDSVTLTPHLFAFQTKFIVGLVGFQQIAVSKMRFPNKKQRFCFRQMFQHPKCNWAWGSADHRFLCAFFYLKKADSKKQRRKVRQKTSIRKLKQEMLMQGSTGWFSLKQKECLNIYFLKKLSPFPLPQTLMLENLIMMEILMSSLSVNCHKV